MTLTNQVPCRWPGVTGLAACPVFPCVQCHRYPRENPLGSRWNGDLDSMYKDDERSPAQEELSRPRKIVALIPYSLHFQLIPINPTATLFLTSTLFELIN